MANELAIHYGYSTKPSTLLDSIFMTTVNTAAKTLVTVTSNDKTQQAEKWKAGDHMRFMLMLMTWLAVWALRVLMDHFPFSNPYLFERVSHNIRSFEHLLPSSSSLSSAFSSLSSVSSSPSSSMDLVISEESESASVKPLGRALTNAAKIILAACTDKLLNNYRILALLNEIPASSRKYQFAVAMADKIVDENTRGGHVELLQINRRALGSAFARTCGLLYRSLQITQTTDDSGSWASRITRAIPLGSYVVPVLKGLGSFIPGFNIATSLLQQNKRQLAITGEGRVNDVAAEKQAQELLWITNKMVGCGAVDEALEQWSLASGLASQALTTNPRVQGFIVKITAILFGEAKRAKLSLEVERQVKYGLLAIWVPVFCYAENGLAYPVMTGYEKAEMERIMDDLISSLPAIDQEVILTNWLQDFTISASDWPNLQVSYDRWCQSTRKQIM